MRIAIFGKEFNDNQLDYVRILVEVLENKGCKLLIWKPFYDFIKDRISFSKEVALFNDHRDLKGQADLLFSVGGDGTMLHSVRLVRDSGNPYLTGVCCINMDESVPDERITTIFETVKTLRKEFELMDI